MLTISCRNSLVIPSPPEVGRRSICGDTRTSEPLRILHNQRGSPRLTIDTLLWSTVTFAVNVAEIGHALFIFSEWVLGAVVHFGRFTRDAIWKSQTFKISDQSSSTWRRPKSRAGVIRKDTARTSLWPGCPQLFAWYSNVLLRVTAWFMKFHGENHIYRLCLHLSIDLCPAVDRSRHLMSICLPNLDLDAALIGFDCLALFSDVLRLFNCHSPLRQYPVVFIPHQTVIQLHISALLWSTVFI